MGEDRTLPRVRTNGLVIKELPDETLIYDVETSTAFCLNLPAAVIMNACNGANTVEDAQTMLAQRLGSSVGTELIWNTIEEFRRRDLLAEATEPFAEKLVPRRTLLKQAAAFGAAVPVVMALVAPPALHAASTCLSQGQTCVPLQQPVCCPNLVCVPNPQTETTSWCQPQNTRPTSVPLDPNAPPDITINGLR